MNSFLRLAFLCALLCVLLGRKEGQDTRQGYIHPVPEAGASLLSHDGILPPHIRLDVSIAMPRPHALHEVGKHRRLLCESTLLQGATSQIGLFQLKFLENKPRISYNAFRHCFIPDDGDPPLSA